MNEVVWCAESRGSFLEGLPLSLGWQLVFWPGGCKPSSLAGALGPHCLSLGLSSRARTTRRGIHTSCSGGSPRSSEAGVVSWEDPPLLKCLHCVLSLLVGGGKNLTAPELLLRWQVQTGVLRSCSRNWSTCGTPPPHLAVFKLKLYFDNHCMISCKYE